MLCHDWLSKWIHSLHLHVTMDAMAPAKQLSCLWLWTAGTKITDLCIRMVWEFLWWPLLQLNQSGIPLKIGCGRQMWPVYKWTCTSPCWRWCVSLDTVVETAVHGGYVKPHPCHIWWCHPPLGGTRKTLQRLQLFFCLVLGYWRCTIRCPLILEMPKGYKKVVSNWLCLSIRHWW